MSIVLYMTCFAASILLATQKKIQWLCLSALILFILSAMRFDVGFDYTSYYLVISNGECERFTFLSTYLCKISDGRPTIFFMFNSLLFIFGMYFFAHTSKISSWLVVAFFVGNAFLLLSSFNFVRQFSAIGICLVSFYFFNNRANFISILLICLAASIHVSAVVFFIIFPLRHPVFSFAFVHALGISTILFIEALVSTWVKMQLPFFGYLTGHTFTGAGVVNLAMLAILIYCSEFFRIVYRRSYEKDFTLELKLAICSFYLYFALLFINVHAARISFYLLPFVSFTVHLILRHFNYRKSIMFVFVLSQVGYIMFATTRDGVRSPYIPYQTWVDKNEYDLRQY